MPAHPPIAPGAVLRHFTVAVFVVSAGHVLLHYHRKLGRWLPPGGHIEDNELPDEAKAYLGREGYDPVFGARPLRRTVQREVENHLARQLLAGQIRDGDTVRVDVGAHGLGACAGRLQHG